MEFSSSGTLYPVGLVLVTGIYLVVMICLCCVPRRFFECSAHHMKRCLDWYCVAYGMHAHFPDAVTRERRAHTV